MELTNYGFLLFISILQILACTATPTTSPILVSPKKGELLPNEDEEKLHEINYDYYLDYVTENKKPVCPLSELSNCSDLEYSLKVLVFEKFDLITTQFSVVGNITIPQEILALNVLSNCELEHSMTEYDSLGKPAPTKWEFSATVEGSAEFFLKDLAPRKFLIFRLVCDGKLYGELGNETDSFVSIYREVYTSGKFPGPSRLEIYHNDQPFGNIAISEPYLDLRWTLIENWPGKPMYVQAKCVGMNNTKCAFRCRKSIELCETCQAALTADGNVWTRVGNVHWSFHHLQLGQFPPNITKVACAIRGVSATEGVGDWSLPAIQKIDGPIPPPTLLISFYSDDRKDYRVAEMDLALLTEENKELHQIKLLRTPRVADGQDFNHSMLIDFSIGSITSPFIIGVPESYDNEKRDGHIDFANDWISSRHFVIEECFDARDEYRDCIKLIYDGRTTKVQDIQVILQETRGSFGTLACDAFGTRYFWTESHQTERRNSNYTLKWSLIPFFGEGESPKDFIVNSLSDCRNCPITGILKPMTIDWKSHWDEEWLAIFFLTLPGDIWSVNLPRDDDSLCFCSKKGRIEELEPLNIKRISVDWDYFYWLTEDTSHEPPTTAVKFIERKEFTGKVRRIEQGFLIHKESTSQVALYHQGGDVVQHSWIPASESSDSIPLDFEPRSRKIVVFSHISDIKASAPEMRISPDRLVEITDLYATMIAEDQVKITIVLDWGRRYRPVMKITFKLMDWFKTDGLCHPNDDATICGSLTQIRSVPRTLQGNRHSILLGDLTPGKSYQINASVTHFDSFQMITSQPNPTRFCTFKADFSPSRLKEFLIGGFVALLILLLFCLAVIWYLYQEQWKLRHVPRIPEREIQLKEKLGAGHFSTVHRGVHRDKIVAVKLLKVNAGPSDKKGFLQEAIILGYLQHNHIIRELGVCLSSRPYMIILEFIDGGNAQKYLRKHQANLDITTLLKIANHICKACVYLAEQGYMHRDLSAKNVLIGLDPKNGSFKSAILADFGLAIDSGVADNPYNSDRPEFPIRHAAPECFQGDFTKESDVYSFGIFLWEVFSYGRTPFEEIRDPKELEFRRQYEKDLYLSQPESCPDELYSLMQHCWAEDPKKRPKIQSVKKSLETSISLFRKESSAPARVSCNGSEICLLDSSSARSETTDSTSLGEANDTSNTPSGRISDSRQSAASSMEFKAAPVSPPDDSDRRNRSGSNSGLFLSWLNRKRNNSSNTEMRPTEEESVDAKPQVVASGYLTADDYSQRIQAV